MQWYVSFANCQIFLRQLARFSHKMSTMCLRYQMCVCSTQNNLPADLNTAFTLTIYYSTIHDIYQLTKVYSCQYYILSFVETSEVCEPSWAGTVHQQPDDSDALWYVLLHCPACVPSEYHCPETLGSSCTSESVARKPTSRRMYALTLYN